MPVSKLDLEENLRPALIEALREDWEDTLSGEDTPEMSLRQRRRFRKMLADPQGYCRRYFRGGKQEPEGGTRVFISPVEVRIRRKHVVRVAMAAVIAALLAGSALAYSLTGGAFFTHLFGLFGRELGLDAGVADMSQLAITGDAELGTILETDELRFELLDAASGGYMSMAAIRVTCKQLDRAIVLDGDGKCLMQATFADMSGTLVDFDSIADAGYGCSYYYEDDEKGLKPNQFYLIVSTNGTQTVRAGTYTLGLHNLIQRGEGGETVLYEGDWTLNIPLEDGEKYARTVPCGTAYTMGKTDYLLEKVQYSTLSMNLYFSSAVREPEDQQFSDYFTDYSITLKNGKVLNNKWFCCGIGSGSDDSGMTAHVTLEFNAPLNVDQIASVQFGGHSVNLTGEK